MGPRFSVIALYLVSLCLLCIAAVVGQKTSATARCFTELLLLSRAAPSITIAGDHRILVRPLLLASRIIIMDQRVYALRFLVLWRDRFPRRLCWFLAASISIVWLSDAVCLRVCALPRL